MIGVKLAIDDFGSGDSSLGYLGKLPVDVLKIDRGFVQALGTNPGDTLIISSVSRIAHSRGMVVVAEGIEDAALAERVRELGCDIGQGYYFAKPLPAQLATSYLARPPQIRNSRCCRRRRLKRRACSRQLSRQP